MIRGNLSSFLSGARQSSGVLSDRTASHFGLVILSFVQNYRICSSDHDPTLNRSNAGTTEGSASLSTRLTGPFHCRARAKNAA